MSNISLAEVAAAKSLAEAAITAALDRFQYHTGLEVSGISLDSYCRIGGLPNLLTRLEVKLP